jgi:hypothetical protein
MTSPRKEAACEIAMPDWVPGSRRVWLHDISPAEDNLGRVSARASRPFNRYPAAAGALGPAGDDYYLSSVPDKGARVPPTRRTGFLAAPKDGACARDLR